MPIRRRWALLALPFAAVMTTGTTPPTTLTVDLSGMRSAKGVLQLCLTTTASNFPGCLDDAHATTRVVSASQRTIVFVGLPRGDYAIAVIHDENANRRLDTFAGIPREGFGFSRNPTLRTGPPRFADARFAFEGATVQTIRMRYLL